jgi:hypothetical protein
MIHKDLRYTPEEKIARVLALYDKYGVRATIEEQISARFAAAAAALDGLSASVSGSGSGSGGSSDGLSGSGSGSVAPDRIEEFKAFALSMLGRTK